MGTGPGLKLVRVSVCSISICYRGWNPLNRNVAKFVNRDMQRVGLIFPPAATVGSPVMAVCDTVPGRINPVEGIVIY